MHFATQIEYTGACVYQLFYLSKALWPILLDINENLHSRYMQVQVLKSSWPLTLTLHNQVISKNIMTYKL